MYCLANLSAYLWVNTDTCKSSHVVFLKSLWVHRRTLETEIMLMTAGTYYLPLHQVGKLVLFFWQTDHILSSLAFTRYLPKGIYKESKE